jgi:chromosome partitioning protein
MLVISFITQKGGAGKSTLAFSTAVAAHEAGERVAILDLDYQGAATSWAQTRARTDLFVDAVEIRDLETRIEELSVSGYTLCILDAPVDEYGSERAILSSDLCIIPSRPNVFDLRAGAATWRKAHSAGKAAAFVLNQCPPMRQIARIQEGVKALEALGVLLSPMISARVDFQDAARAGLGVTELHAKGQAASEVREMWASILSITRTEPSALDTIEPEALDTTEELRAAA